MGRHCIVHIGPHKTGSSSIQQTLFRELRTAEFEYAQLGPANQGRFLQFIVSTTPEETRHARLSGMTPMHAERKNPDRP